MTPKHLAAAFYGASPVVHMTNKKDLVFINKRKQPLKGAAA